MKSFILTNSSLQQHHIDLRQIYRKLFLIQGRLLMVVEFRHIYIAEFQPLPFKMSIIYVLENVFLFLRAISSSITIC